MPERFISLFKCDPKPEKYAGDYLRGMRVLCPKDHPIATKRLRVDTEYYQTYNRDNITLVSIRNAARPAKLSFSGHSIAQDKTSGTYIG